MENLRVYIVTWNVATRAPEEDFHAMLGFDSARSNDLLPDFYVVALQEVKSQPQNMLLDALFDDPWTNAFRDILAAKDYVKVKTIRLQGLVLSLFCLRKHLLHLRDIETQYTRTGFGGMWGNKGAVTIRLGIYGCSMCLVNCHLTPHDNLLQYRINDYNAILTSQTFQVKETSNIFFHDYVFWTGDLNFRLADGYTSQEVLKLIKQGELTQLVEKDQLRQVMSTGDAFSELSEKFPNFAPTYKFDFHSSNYDLKRRPSWTDRILYRVNTHAYENLTLSAEQVSYRSHEQYLQSDHKPVSGEFIVKVFSDYYERVIEFQPLQTWYLEEENAAVYSIPSDVQPTVWDWIGIFKADFSSLDDYLSYVYVPRQDMRTSRLMRVIFPETAIRTPGTYRLLYFSQNSGSVLGMSDPFHILNREGNFQMRF